MVDESSASVIGENHRCATGNEGSLTCSRALRLNSQRAGFSGRAALSPRPVRSQRLVRCLSPFTAGAPLQSRRRTGFEYGLVRRSICLSRALLLRAALASQNLSEPFLFL